MVSGRSSISFSTGAKVKAKAPGCSLTDRTANSPSKRPARNCAAVSSASSAVTAASPFEQLPVTEAAIPPCSVTDTQRVLSPSVSSNP